MSSHNFSVFLLEDQQVMSIFFKNEEKSRFLRNNENSMANYRNELLNKSTSAEKSVCRILSALNVQFIRQYPVRTARKCFYIDIYIPTLKLAIEVDGKYHFTDNQKRLDSNRSACLRRLGIHIYRINNSNAYSTNKVKKLLIKYQNKEKAKKNAIF